MTEVTSKKFFKVLYADPRDIMPSIVGSWSDEDGYTSEWRTNDNRRVVFGRSSGKGYGDSPSRYWIEDHLLNARKAS